MSLISNVAPDAVPPARPMLTCRLCAQQHRGAPLRRGQRAVCVRCGALLARRGWMGANASLAFAATGVALALPASVLPFITVAKIGREHTGYLLTGAITLWNDSMPLLAVWVGLCGAFAPIVLLVTLASLLTRVHRRRSSSLSPAWQTIAHALEHWAMPEVHVLAVLVALIKLGSLVDVHIGPGFWSYTAMATALLLAWRGYDLDPAEITHHPARRAEAEA